MESNNQFSGSNVAIVTPFTTDGLVCYESFGKLIELHIANGTDGIVVCGTTGEAATLNDEEYKEVVQFAIKKIDKRLQVIIGTGSNSTAKAIEQSIFAANEGADGLLIVGPYYNKPNQEGFYQHFAAIARKVETPIILYNVPGRTSKNISAATTIQLAQDFQNIVGIKEASGDLSQIMEIIHGAPADFSVLSGDDALTIPIISLGGHGCISVVANITPLLFSRMIQHALADNFAEAKKLHYKLLPLMQLCFIDSNPIPVKTALHLMGLIEDEFRLPLCPMSDQAKINLIKTELTNLNLLTKDQVAASTEKWH